MDSTKTYSHSWILRDVQLMLYFHNKLLLTEVYLDRHTREIILLTDMILKEAAIVLADVLREVAEECKLRSWGWQLHCILDADILTLHGWWRGLLDNWQDKVVELRSRDAA